LVATKLTEFMLFLSHIQMTKLAHGGNMRKGLST
jgi:hypothetical protein